MSFFYSTAKVRVDDRGRLHGRCKNADANHVDSSIDLNTLFGNNNGEFEYGGKDFLNSAYGIRLEGSVLHAELQDGDGREVHAAFDLNDVIENNNGKLVALDQATRVAREEDDWAPVMPLGWSHRDQQYYE